MDVVDGVDDLADLLGVLVLAVDLVLEVLFERAVLLVDLFQLQLQRLHLPLLLVQGVLKLCQLLRLVDPRLLHLLVDLLLALHELLILCLKVLEPVLQRFNVFKFLSVSIALPTCTTGTSFFPLVLHNGIEEVIKLFKLILLLLLSLEIFLGHLKFLLEFFDLFLLLLDVFLFLFKLRLLLLLHVVLCSDLADLLLDFADHLLLLFLEFVLLYLELLRILDNLLLLAVEFLICFPLLAFSLEQAHSLKGSLAYNLSMFNILLCTTYALTLFKSSSPTLTLEFLEMVLLMRRKRSSMSAC